MVYGLYVISPVSGLYCHRCRPRTGRADRRQGRGARTTRFRRTPWRFVCAACTTLTPQRPSQPAPRPVTIARTSLLVARAGSKLSSDLHNLQEHQLLIFVTQCRSRLRSCRVCSGLWGELAVRDRLARKWAHTLARYDGLRPARGVSEPGERTNCTVRIRKHQASNGRCGFAMTEPGPALVRRSRGRSEHQPADTPR
jgi:hypothetical protein